MFGSSSLVIFLFGLSFTFCFCGCCVFWGCGLSSPQVSLVCISFLSSTYRFDVVSLVGAGGWSEPQASLFLSFFSRLLIVSMSFSFLVLVVGQSFSARCFCDFSLVNLSC